ncbi:MAG TPA: hypothetical protein VF533_17360 [Solirubrobacteraceae bacterium]|jgi:hypothetical protein
MRARFPTIAADRGHYESYYLRAAHPERPLALWLRHTVHKPPGGPAVGAQWLTLFDAERGEPPAAFKASGLTPRAATAGSDTGDGIVLGDSVFTAQGVHGATPGGEGRWAIDVRDGAPALAHLPRAWMYRAPVPRTKSGSPHPAARLHGTVALHGRTLELDGWPGMVGHNWGAEHAERWIWLHGIAFDGAPDAWLDLVCGRIAIAGRTTPWVTNGVLHLDGVRHRLGGLGPGAIRATRVTETPTTAHLELPGADGLRVTATVAEPPAQAAAWRYADPSGGEHVSTHCSVARLELALTPSGRRLTTRHAAAYELGTREAPAGVPVLPFPDP